MAEGDDLALLGNFLDRLDPLLAESQDRLLPASGSTSRLNTQSWPVPNNHRSAAPPHPQSLTSMPIPSAKWSWAPLDTGIHQPPASAPLFLEPSHLPDFGLNNPSPSTVDTTQSLASSAQRQSSLDASLHRGNSGVQGSPNQGKSFKELHAERNKQAQRRFRKRQKEKMTELQAKLSKLEGEKADQERQRTMLSGACQLRDEELRKVKERQSLAAEAEDAELARAFQGGVTLTFRENETITLTPDEIKNMSAEALAKYWSNYVKELAVLLVAVEGNDNPPAAVVERIQELVQRELLFLYIRAALTNMQSVKKFIAKAKIEEVRMSQGPNPTPNLWCDVSKSLQLSLEQRQSVVTLWHNFNEQVSKLLEQRRVIHSSITATVHRGQCGQESAQKYLQANELMDQLKKNLRAEHVLIHEFLVEWYLHKLTTMQMAKCFVRSFPFYPDIPAIAAWVAVGQNDPVAHSKLHIMEAASPSNSM